MVYRIALHECGNSQDAEDVMQNVFLRLYKTARPPLEDEHIRYWLIRVTVREAKRLFLSPFRKRETLWEDIFKGRQGNEKETESKEETEENEVLEKVMLLPGKYRTVVYLYYYEEYRIKEIAEILGRRESTVQTQLLRARKKLGKMLEEAGKYEKRI